MNDSVLAKELELLITKSKPTIICGDFNLCYIDHRDNDVIRFLESNGFAQLVSKATHLQGGHIDQVYSNSHQEQYRVDVTLYSPFYLAKDHDAILITVTKAPRHIPPGRGKYKAYAKTR